MTLHGHDCWDLRNASPASDLTVVLWTRLQRAPLVFSTIHLQGKEAKWAFCVQRSTVPSAARPSVASLDVFAAHFWSAYKPAYASSPADSLYAKDCLNPDTNRIAAWLTPMPLFMVSHRESTLAENESDWENVFLNWIKPSKAVKEEAAGAIKVGRNSPSLHPAAEDRPLPKCQHCPSIRASKGNASLLARNEKLNDFTGQETTGD